MEAKFDKRLLASLSNAAKRPFVGFFQDSIDFYETAYFFSGLKLVSKLKSAK